MFWLSSLLVGPNIDSILVFPDVFTRGFNLTEVQPGDVYITLELRIRFYIIFVM